MSRRYRGFRGAGGWIWRFGGTLAAMLPAVMIASTVFAFEIDTGSPDWKIRRDNTLKYSVAFRLQDQDEDLIDDINTDELAESLAQFTDGQTAWSLHA